MSQAVSAWLSPSINMHDHNPLQFIGPLSFALFALLACLAILGMRGDGERIIFPDSQLSQLKAETQNLNEEFPVQPQETANYNWEKASFDSPVNGKIALFVCAPEQNKQELEALSEMDVQTIGADGIITDIDRITLTAPMPLEIPDDFAEKHALSTRVVCNDSEIINLDELETESNFLSEQPTTQQIAQTIRNDVMELPPSGTPATRQITIPDNAFVVAAVSDAGHLHIEKFLFFFFLIALWTGIALFSRQFRLNTCHFKRYDFLLAFGGGNLLALLLIEAISFLPFEKNSLLPGFGEMLAMLFVNFAGFLLTAAFFVWLRLPKHTPWFRTIPSEIDILLSNTTNNDALNALKESESPADDLLSSHTDKAELNSENEVNSEPKTTSLQKDQASTPPDAWIPVKLRYPLILGVSLAILGSIVVFLLVEQPGLTTFTMASQLVSTLFLTGIFALLAAISEESVFRGIIQSSLEARKDSPKPMLTNAIAIAIASALFVGMHVPQSIDHLWALVPIAAVSITSGILKIHYRTIFPCILLHMTYNATLVVPGILIA